MRKSSHADPLIVLSYYLHKSCQRIAFYIHGYLQILIMIILKHYVLNQVYVSLFQMLGVLTDAHEMLLLKSMSFMSLGLLQVEQQVPQQH